MGWTATASTAIEPIVAGPPRTAVVLGVTDAAVYLAVEADPGHRRDVLAILTADAVRLPCALVLGFTSAQRRLTPFGPRPGDRMAVGNGCVHWAGSAGSIVIRSVRRWTPARVEPPAAGWASGLTVLSAQIADTDIGLPPALLASSCADRAGALLGRGPGLTPSGDDVLAGLLLGAAAFGTPQDGLAEAIDADADARTTALSARLLRHAIHGDCVPELSTLIAALPDSYAVEAATAALLRVGHTSGAALARGVVMAAHSRCAGRMRA
jgi:Protein of unknown function (DUF2877)